MRRDNAARLMPTGSTVEEHVPGLPEPLLWWKIRENMWDDGNNNLVNDAAMNTKLAAGAEQVVSTIDLKTEPVDVAELEANDYIVLSYGAWYHGDLLDDTYSQMLWRVAGWTKHNSIVLDAPEGVLLMVSRAEHGAEDYDVEPILPVLTGESRVMYVTTGQEHDTWTYDWDFDYGPLADYRDDL